MSKTLDRIGPFKTKAAEVEFLKDLVERLPSSYLRDVLSPFVDDFEQGVYSDFVPAVRDSWDARVEAEKDVKAAKAVLDDLRKQKRDLEQSVAREVARLDEIATLARKVAAAADYSVSQAKSLDRRNG